MGMDSVIVDDLIAINPQGTAVIGAQIEFVSSRSLQMQVAFKSNGE
jgi:hypothetical protein